MKTKLIIFLSSIILISALAFFWFFKNEDATKAKEFKIKASNYEKTGNELSKQTLNIQKEVNKKNLLYEAEMNKIESSLKKLEMNRKKNKELIDSNKLVQEKLLKEYCDDMKEIGQFNIGRCNN